MKKYLKQNVAIEPLFFSWYLWSYLVPPHTASYYLQNRYLKTLRSFLEEPALHRAASKNPKLAGGQFIDLDDDSLIKIEKILKDVEEKGIHVLALANAIDAFEEKLIKNGDGHSLEHLYSELPSALQGTVELVYDRNNYPGIYFFEKILYDRFYDKTMQSVVFTPLKSDNRKFVLATPRVIENDELMLSLPYDSPLLAEIARSRFVGMNINDIKSELNLTDPDWMQLQTYFTDKPPSLQSAQYKQPGIRIRYFGHACLLMQTKDISILVDPLISYFQPEGGIDRFFMNDLPEKIDYVLFSHNHLDHISFETLLFLKDRVRHFVFQGGSGGTLINPNLTLILSTLGFKGLISLDYLEELPFSGGRILSFPFLGEHGDLNIQSKAAFYIELLGYKMLLAADSNNLDNGLYEYIHKKVGSIDTLFIGMECVGGPLDWIYGPLLSKSIKHSHKHSRRYSGSDSAKAYKLMKALQAKEVYVYAMGQEAWLSHITSLNYDQFSPQLIESEKLIAVCSKDAIPCKRLYGKDEWFYKTEAVYHA